MAYAVEGRVLPRVPLSLEVRVPVVELVLRGVDHPPREEALVHRVVLAEDGELVEVHLAGGVQPRLPRPGERRQQCGAHQHHQSDHEHQLEEAEPTPIHRASLGQKTIQRQAQA